MRLRSAPFLFMLLAGPALHVQAADPAPFEPERGTMLIPRDCRFESDKERCAADNRAIDFCREEKDATGLHACLRANQPALVCESRKNASAKERCERINRIYQPCKGRRGAELASCVDQRRTQEKRKKLT